MESVDRLRDYCARCKAISCGDCKVKAVIEDIEAEHFAKLREAYLKKWRIKKNEHESQGKGKT